MDCIQRLPAVGGFGQAVAVEHHEVVGDAVDQPRHGLLHTAHAVQVVEHQGGEAAHGVGGQGKAVEARTLGTAECLAVGLILQNLRGTDAVPVDGAGLQVGEADAMLGIVYHLLASDELSQGVDVQRVAAQFYPRVHAARGLVHHADAGGGGVLQIGFAVEQRAGTVAGKGLLGRCRQGKDGHHEGENFTHKAMLLLSGQTTVITAAPPPSPCRRGSRQPRQSAPPPGCG